MLFTQLALKGSVFTELLNINQYKSEIRAACIICIREERVHPLVLCLCLLLAT